MPTATHSILKKKFDLDPISAKILVVGLGSTGISVARYLKKMGYQFAIIDSRKHPPLMEEFFNLMPDTPVFTGGFDDAAFKVATHLVVSPGLSLNEKSIIKAVANGSIVMSDIDLFACSVQTPIIAITGSNGKSTVTTMLGDMVKAAGKKGVIGGNLGVPALDLLDEEAELYVLELSSFQLERTSMLNANAATILNISPDHLDRHSSVIEYAKEKQNVFNGNGAMVINIDDPIVNSMIEPQRQTYTFSIKTTADFYLAQQTTRQDDSQTTANEYLMYQNRALLALSELPLEGRHNAANALAALALGHAVGLPLPAMCEALKKFKGLEHRMQRVATLHGITWINDSKATNIGACVAALEGYQTKVILIAGGDAKGADMNELAPIIQEKAKALILMGKDAALFNDALMETSLPIYHAENMQQAVQLAAQCAHSGDHVLLSPACASLDQYKNYQDRGNKFSKAVLALAH
ncbi:MAG: UDP-N-acetylmuramoyl-L-alanine--D-glutamate ligase [Methylococcaceae bacterium]|jgi:UDP-N-acetylmuramoylalanine--D-glutamate ligase|nr:MAG: UDP-N-acetylmuramoyl-L-alanine--D-glutamate ligase [Methylococcaceae bacterium]